MLDRVSYKNNVEHTLFSESQGRVEISEPLNFDDGNRNIYERDDESKGYIVARTNDLEFHGEGANTLLRQAVTKGVAEDILLEKRIKSDDRIDELWRSTFPVYLDLANLEITQKKGGGIIAKTKAIEGGLKKIIDSKISDSFDITSTFDAFGNIIPPLLKENIFLESREIFLRSVLSVEDNTEISATVSGGDRLNARCFPFSVDINSDQANIDYVLGNKLSAANNTYASLSADKVGNCFITSSDVAKRLVINGKVKATIIDRDIPTGTNSLDIVVYEGFGDFTVKEIITLATFNPNNLGEIIEFDFNDYILDINQGDSVTIGLLSDTADGIRYNVTETEIIIEEDSIFPPSNSNVLTYKQVLNRLLYIITGIDNLVVSDLLTDGVLSEDTLANGFWIRQFPDVINEGTDEERKIQFNVSIEQVLQHIEALLPKAWWTEKIGTQEYFRLEAYSYTQQNFTGIHFGNIDESGKIIYVEANDIKRKHLAKNFYSKLEFGSEKGGDNYEEVFGLRSINGKASFSTINTNNESVYSVLSPFRLADVDAEIPRRKPYSLYPEEDTRFDSDIVCFRSKKVNGTYYPKKWQDVFEVVPTGIYRPDSAYNLDTTPARLLLQHSSKINVGLYLYPNQKIIWAESNCNSSFISKKVGENILAEDQPIPHSRLDKPTIRPWSVDCVAEVSQEIEDNITGMTDGVFNWFGLVAINTGQGLEYFRLVKSDLNKEGKHKFVEAYI